VLDSAATDFPLFAPPSEPISDTKYAIGLIDAGIPMRAVDGVALHGAFFLGPKSFYRALHEMPPDRIARICMMPVSFTNEFYGDEDRKRRDRVDLTGFCSPACASR
jgi:hypothetical protein